MSDGRVAGCADPAGADPGSESRGRRDAARGWCALQAAGCGPPSPVLACGHHLWTAAADSGQGCPARMVGEGEILHVRRAETEKVPAGQPLIRGDSAATPAGTRPTYLGKASGVGHWRNNGPEKAHCVPICRRCDIGMVRSVTAPIHVVTVRAASGWPTRAAVHRWCPTGATDGGWQPACAHPGRMPGPAGGAAGAARQGLRAPPEERGSASRGRARFRGTGCGAPGQDLQAGPPGPTGRPGPARRCGSWSARSRAEPRSCRRRWRWRRPPA